MMKNVRKLGAGLTVMACAALVASPALANHKVNVGFLVRLPIIQANGVPNVGVGPIVAGNAQVNTKNGDIKAKANGNVLNFSGNKVKFKGLNGLVFQSNIPAGVAATLAVTYQVKANGSAKWSAKN